MSATILIKRTQGTSPPTAAPVGTGVSFGELIYTYDVANVGAGKSYKKLYIGDPSGNTAAPIPIGGEYYTQVIADNPADFGKPVANKAVILNSDAKVSSWTVATDLLVGAAATVSGDLSVSGNLNVTGDLVYDEVTGRNINITGVATIATLGITSALEVEVSTAGVGVVTALSGVGGTFLDWNATSGQFEQVNVSHAATVRNLTVTGISTIENNYDFRTQLIRIGREAGVLETDGNDRQGFFIGNFAGSEAGITTLTKRNIAIGHSAFQKGGQTKAESNLFVGNFAGQGAEGSYNIFLGDKAGQDLGAQTIIQYGETGEATTIQFSNGSTLPNDPYNYRAYGSIAAAGISSISGGMFAIAVESLSDLSIVNTAVSGNLTFTIGGASNGHLDKTKAGPFTIKGSDDFGLLTDKNDAIYLSSGSIGLSGSYGFLIVNAGITTTSGKENHLQNIGLGREALWGAGISTDQSNNIAIGAYSLYNVLGDDNIAIGQSAGKYNTGSGNVIIGLNQDVAQTTEDTQLIIGSGDTKWISGNNVGWVGIGTTTPDALLAVNGDVSVSGVATIPQIDVNDLGVEAAYVTAGIVTSLVGTYGTITTLDVETLDAQNINITGVAVTDIVGTAATISVFDTETADLRDVKITAGIITDIVGTAATITTLDVVEGDIVNAKITAGIITDIVGTAATITTVDFNTADIVTATIGSGIVTTLDASSNVTIGGGLTVTGFVDLNNSLDVEKDFRVGGASTFVGNVTFKGGTIGLGDSITDNVVFNADVDSNFIPDNDDTYDIGSSDQQWKDIYIDGVAYIDDLSVDSQVGVYATITTLDVETADLKDVKITSGIITDIVGTAATITTIDATEGDIVNAKITAGVVTSLVGTYATISTVDIETLDAKDVNITGLAVTDIVGTAATITTFDAENADLNDIKVTTGLVTSLVGTYATITTAQVTNLSADSLTLTGLAVTDVVVATAATFTGVIDVNDADIVNAKITAGVVTSLVGTYATITTLDVETLDAQNINITGVAVTDIVGTSASITTIDVTNLDALTAKINAGYVTALYDSTGVVGVNTQHMLSTNAAGELVWKEPAQIGIATINAKLDTWFVSTNGVDDGEPSRGRTAERPFRTIAYALSQITSIGVNDVLSIAAGVYQETFPLTVPAGLTIKGAGLRATKIIPTNATKQKDAFLLNDRSVIEDITIADMFFNTSANEGYAFKYAPGIAITSRSPYVQRVTVFNKGSNVTASDPYGYASADSNPSSYISGGGAYLDGSEVASGSLEAAMLFNEVTFIVPNSKGIVMTNGSRCEYINCFTYFASEAIKGESGSLGIHSTGQTRLRLTGITTVGVGNTITLFDTDGTTSLGSAVVASYDGTYLGVTGKQLGFEVLNARTAKTVTFNDDAQLDTTVKKFGTASLKLDGANDSISIPSSGDLGFGTNTDFTIEFWAYANTTGLSSATLFDLRDNGTDAEGLSLAFRAAGEVDLRVGTTTAITGSGAGIATGVWKHYAIAREGTDTRLFVDGTQRGIKFSDTTDYGSSKGIVFGADFDGASNNVTGWIDEVRIEKGVAKYTGNFTAPTSAPTGDKDTKLLLHFDGTSGIKTTSDDVIRNQDVRITQAGGGIGTATKIILADYSQFGADMRSVSCAVEYGQKGVIADGDGVTMRLFALNFNMVGAGGDITNDPNLAIQANEVTEVNNGDVSYVSIDQKGDFRVGEAFFVDQENGTVSFSQQVTSLQALSNLTITDGSNSSQITPNSGTFGNIQIAGNNIESTSGDINIDPAGSGDINITGDVNILGILTATVIQLDAFQKNDTSIALDDSGSDGTIRFNTDNVEGMRLDANQKLGIGTAAPRDRLDVLDTARFENVNVTGVTTVVTLDVNGDLDVDGHAELDQLNVAGVATITTFDTETADLKTVKITSGIITDIVGTGATITTIDANSFDTVNAKINTGLATNFTVGQTIGDGSLTINSPVGLNSHTDIPDNVEVRIGDNTDFKIYHQDTDAFNNRGHVILQHANGNTTYGRVQVRSDYFSVQTAAGNSDFLMTDDKTLKLMYADTNASGVGDRVIIRASGTELLGISSFIDNGVYKGEVSIGTSITATAGVITANAIDLADADILDAKITAGLATDFAITNLKSQSGIITDLNVVADIRVGGAMTVTGIATFQNDVFVGGNLNVVGDVVYDEIDGRNINITGISTLNNLIVTGISTISDLLIGAGSSTTKITTNSGELVLDSTAGQVTIQDNVHVVGYATFKNGLYYRSDQGGSTGIGYSGPNGMAYFEDDGRLVSSASTVGFLTTSNYVMTTNASGVPQWTNSIDGGFF